MTFVASLSFCVYYSYSVFSQYYQYQSTINTQILKEIPTQFLAVSICNLNTVNSTFLYEFNLNLFAYFYTNPSNIDWNETIPYVNYTWFPIFKVFMIKYGLRLALNDPALTDFKDKFGFQINNMLISCKFNENFCYPSDFFYFYHPWYGNCYTFNSGKTGNGIQNVSIAGINYGIKVELYSGIPYWDELFESDRGFIYSIHNQSEVPFTRGNIIKVMSGEETDLIINRNFIEHLGLPNGDYCIDFDQNDYSMIKNPDIIDYFINYLGIDKYSAEYCVSICIQSQIIKYVNCSALWLPVYRNNTNYCNKLYQYFSFQNLITNSTVNEYCKQACPFECKYIDYSINSFRAKYPNDYYVSLLSSYLKYLGFNMSNSNDMIH